MLWFSAETLWRFGIAVHRPFVSVTVFVSKLKDTDDERVKTVTLFN